MEAYLKAFELGRNKGLFRVPQLRKYTIPAGALLIYWALKVEYGKYQSEIEKQLKKERLSMPVYEMTDDDYENPPWTGENYNHWKYRLIKVKGREVHVKSMQIPKRLNDYHGFGYFIPLIHKEDGKLENQVGIIINKGWMPHEYSAIQSRVRIEDSQNQKEYVGMLNRGEEYKLKNFFKQGNVFDEQRWIWNNFYLPDMARAIKLNNTKALSQGVVELLNFEETKLDETDPLHYAKDLSLTLPYPHPKTLSGALQPFESKWDLKKKQFVYGVAGVALLMY